MSGFRSSLFKAALIAATLFLSMAASASYADVAQQLKIARNSHAASAQAHYPTPASASAQSGKCLGGAHWMQRSFNTHRTESQMMMPMPCP